MLKGFPELASTSTPPPSNSPQFKDEIGGGLCGAFSELTAAPAAVHVPAGSRVKGLGFRIWDLGFEVWDLGFGVRGLGYGVRGSG